MSEDISSFRDIFICDRLSTVPLTTKSAIKLLYPFVPLMRERLS
jgi:hypothetical protein